MGILSTLFRSIDELIALGYPREVAAKIASNKLDMRPEAVAERRKALFPETFYSGSTSPDILENAPTNMAPQYLWASESPGLAASYAGRRLNRRPDEAPTIYPLAVNTEGFDRVLGGGATWNTLQNPTVLRGSERITMDDITSNTDELLGFAYESGVPGILFQDIVDPGPYQQLMRLGVPSASGGKASQREIDEFLQELERNPPLNMAVSDTTRTRAKYGAAFDPEYTGPNILGSAAGTAGALGLLAAPEEAEAGFINRGGRTLLEAFHGSPYQFDRFDMSKIGTGEGAQAYGHGLYFADSEDVARNYRDMLSSSSEEMETAVWALGRMGNDREAAIKALETGKELGMAGPQSLFDDAAKLLRDEADLSGSGALYRTEIDVTPESLLDWDKPLSEQSEAVQDSLQFFQDMFGSDNPSGREIYHAITNQKRDYQLAKIDSINREMDKMNAIMKADETGYRQFRSDEGRKAAERYDELMDERSSIADKTTAQASQSAATGDLDAFGIKGIKYLDGNSRGAGDGTSNYVIFDDSLINIADRYAIAPPMFSPSQDRALAAANQGLLDPLTVDEQRIQQHQRDINKQMAQIGLLADPMYEYGNIIPAKTNIVTGETSLAFPAIARDIIGGLLDLANTRRSGVYNPAALMDVAL